MPPAPIGPRANIVCVGGSGGGGVSHFVRRGGVGHNNHNDHPAAQSAPPPHRGTLFRNGNKIARCGAEICRKMQKKMPKIKERLFFAFLCGHYSGISGLVSTKTMPDLNVPLDSAGIGPKTRIDVDIQGGTE